MPHCDSACPVAQAVYRLLRKVDVKESSLLHSGGRGMNDLQKPIGV
jgi:hypothetical protein